MPGIGLSWSFRLGPAAWEAPFTAAMQGILSQRQGIDLGPPACAFTRKRTFHPADGVQFYQMDIPVQAGQEGTRGEDLIALAKSGRLNRVEGVWGGYQDAGDWDSLGGHLSATYDLLGLYDLNPAAFSRIKLPLPAEEMSNNLPGILNEALWQMSLWRRLQLPDGGVRGGYGVGWDCYNGETSSMQKYAVSMPWTRKRRCTMRLRGAGRAGARRLRQGAGGRVPGIGQTGLGLGGGARQSR